MWICIRRAALVLSMGLAACGGGSGNSTIFIGGSVRGLLEGTVVVLEDAAAGRVEVNANGAFQLPVPIARGLTYAVRVATQPPGQECTVSNGAGRAGPDDVRDIAVGCFPVHSVSVTVVGRATTTGLVLQNNGDDDLAVSASGVYTFAKWLPAGAPYEVTVKSQPEGNACIVLTAAGVVGATNLNVYVACPSRTGYALSSIAPTLVYGRYIDETTGGLLPSPGSAYEIGMPVVGLAVEGGGRFLYAASDRSIVALSINPSDGSLNVVRSTDVPVGTHALDGILAAVDGHFLLVTSGVSTYSYRIDTVTGELGLVAGSPFATGRSGASVGTWLYTVEDLEAGATAVGAYRIDPVTGALSRIAGSPFGRYVGDYQLRAILPDPQGRFVYADTYKTVSDGYDCPSHAGQIYTIDPLTGALSQTSHWGRARVIDGAGRFAYDAYPECRANDGRIVAYSIDQVTFEFTLVNSIVQQRDVSVAADPAAPFVYSSVGTLRTDPVTGAIIDTFNYAGDFPKVVPQAFARLPP